MDWLKSADNEKERKYAPLFLVNMLSKIYFNPLYLLFTVKTRNFTPHTTPWPARSRRALGAQTALRDGEDLQIKLYRL